MASLPPGQPGLRVAGHGPGTASPARGLSAAIAGGTLELDPALAAAREDAERPGGRLRPPGGWTTWILAALAGLIALRFAINSSVRGKDAIPELAHGILGTCVLFGVTGLGVTRLLLPQALRRHEALWVLPTGACMTGIAMTVLGFLAVPFRVNLAVTVIAGLAFSVHALRRRPLEGRAAALQGTVRNAWPAYLALLIVAIALIPLFRAGFATVEGQGQDAHLAVGSAMFLQHHYPSSIHVDGPVDQMPAVWRSKEPIYYALAAAASVSGLEVYQTLSSVAAVLLGLATLGFFLLSREVLGSPRWAALAGMALVGIDRMVLHTVMHPYFNQTWGFMAMPFAMVLTWWAVRERTRGGLILLAAFMAIVAFAYPLALPIPLVPVAILAWPHRRRVRELKRVYRGRRSLLWLVPLLLVLAVPLLGVVQKITTASGIVFDLSRSLNAWGGDLSTWFPEPQFFGIEGWGWFAVGLPVMLYGAYLALKDQPEALRKGLWGIFAFTLLFTVWFRLRDYGWYFHFKLLAFVGPILIVVALAGFAKLPRRRVGYGLAVLFGALGIAGANLELGSTYDELPKFVLQLRQIDRALPATASIRLDIQPSEQNWTAFWLSGQPLDSEHPLLGTSYPHVQTGRRADFILTKKGDPVPADALGGVVTQLDAYTLYRENPATPGPVTASRRMVQTVRVTTQG